MSSRITYTGGITDSVRRTILILKNLYHVVRLSLITHAASYIFIESNTTNKVMKTVQQFKNMND